MKKNVTIREVASRAKVSMMTVSRVVNNTHPVKEKTRRAVESAILDLGFEPNAIAQSMRSQRTKTIGFILPDITNMTNAFLAQAIESHISGEGYRLMISSTAFDREKEIGVIKLLQQHRVDATILLVSDENDPQIINAIKACRGPVMLLDRDMEIDADAVLSDHLNPMATAVDYLIGLGHRDIAAILPPASIRAGRVRAEGLVQALGRAGLEVRPEWVRYERQVVDDGRHATLEIMSAARRPTALILGANQLTLGALQALGELGLRIPQDVSVIGSDDKVTSALFNPPLTILSRDIAEFGRKAAEIVLQRLKQGPQEPARRYLLPTELLVRRSCAPPSR